MNHRRSGCAGRHAPHRDHPAGTPAQCRGPELAVADPGRPGAADPQRVDKSPSDTNGLDCRQMVASWRFGSIRRRSSGSLVTIVWRFTRPASTTDASTTSTARGLAPSVRSPRRRRRRVRLPGPRRCRKVWGRRSPRSAGGDLAGGRLRRGRRWRAAASSASVSALTARSSGVGRRRLVALLGTPPVP